MARLTRQQWPVSSLATSLLFFCYFSSICYSFSPAESSDWTNAGKQPRVASEKPVSALRWGARSDCLRSGLRCCRCRDVLILRVQKSPLKNATTLRNCCLFLGNLTVSGMEDRKWSGDELLLCKLIVVLLCPAGCHELCELHVGQSIEHGLYLVSL